MLYGLFAVALALVFAYLRFPVETMERFIVARSAELGPDFQTDLERVEPVFPPGIEIRRLSLNRRNQPLFLADRVLVRPKLKTLLGTGKGYRFQIGAHGGRISGSADLSGTRQRPRLRVEGRVQGLELGDLPVMRLISESSLSGILSGHFSYNSDTDGESNLFAEVQVDNLEVALARPLLVLKQIRIEMLRADVVMKNHQLQVRQITLSGDQVEGTLSGTGVIGNGLQDSRLDLAGTLKPQPGILEETGSNGLGGLMSQLASKGIPVRIRGSLDRLQLTTR